MKKLFFLSLFLVFQTLIPTAHAQTPASDSATAVSQSLKERVQKVILEKSQEVKGAQTEEAMRSAYIGTLEKVIGSSIQILTVSKESHICELTPTSIIAKQNKAITKEELELHSAVTLTTVLGDDAKCQVERLGQLLSLPNVPSRQYVLGHFQAMSTKSLTLSLLGINIGAKTNYLITASTKFVAKSGQRMDKKELKVGDKILLSLQETTAATPSASTVYTLSTTY